MYVDGKFDFGESLIVAIHSGVASHAFSWEQAIVMEVDYMLDGLLSQEQVERSMRVLTPEFPSHG
jgi:hypothetical protein